MESIHLPLMFAPARLAVGLESLSVPDATHRPPLVTPKRDHLAGKCLWPILQGWKHKSSTLVPPGNIGGLFGFNVTQMSQK
jgi:hypothetical protein